MQKGGKLQRPVHFDHNCSCVQPFRSCILSFQQEEQAEKTSMDRGETSTRRKTCTSANLYTVNLTHSSLGLHPYLRRERLAGNCVALARPLKAETKWKQRKTKEEGEEKASLFRGFLGFVRSSFR